MDFYEQAEKLLSFVLRGGNAQRWLDSKDFTREQERAILEELRRIQESETNGFSCLAVEQNAD